MFVALSEHLAGEIAPAVSDFHFPAVPFVRYGSSEFVHNFILSPPLSHYSRVVCRTTNILRRSKQYILYSSRPSGNERILRLTGTYRTADTGWLFYCELNRSKKKIENSSDFPSHTHWRPYLAIIFNNFSRGAKLLYRFRTTTSFPCKGPFVKSSSQRNNTGPNIK